MKTINKTIGASVKAKNVKQGNVAALKGKKTTLVKTTEPVTIEATRERVGTILTYEGGFSIEETLKRAQAMARGEKLTPANQRISRNDVRGNCDNTPAKLIRQP